MPVHKNALIRYRTIDKCLRNTSQAWNWKALAEECSREIYIATGKEVLLSERTIKEDLSQMRNNEILGYFAPIEYDRAEKSYRYTDDNFSMVESPFNQAEQDALNQALDVLEQLGGLKEMLGIQPILAKLQRTVFSQNDVSAHQIIFFDQQSSPSGDQWLYRLYRAIVDKRTLNIVYKKFGKDKKSYLLSPHLLKEYQKRWYLLAYSHSDKSMRTYALDRIISVRDSLTNYYFDSTFDGHKFFNNVVGIGLVENGPIEDIKYRAIGVQVDYLITKPLHKSQILLRREEDSALFQISVVVNYELISEILSYRHNIEIISPPDLRVLIKSHIQKMLDLYST